MLFLIRFIVSSSPTAQMIAKIAALRQWAVLVTRLSRIFRDNLSRIFTSPPKTLGEQYFRAGPKPVETFRPSRPGASRVTQKPVALPSGAAAEMTRRLTRLKVAIEDDLTNL